VVAVGVYELAIATTTEPPATGTLAVPVVVAVLES